ncbi:MAG TPA: glutaredoxin domain-containing protein [Polyangiaceae bacterium]|jgi:GrxC family glutaredoxin|nr:glutaredoxin domain-containing protein [Polyangiaceae bacterium]
MGSRVVVYVTSYCSYCVRVKMLLDRRGIPYDVLDVTGDHDKRDWLVSVTKRRTVPQVFIDDVPVGGFDDVQALDRSGRLRELLDAPPPA